MNWTVGEIAIAAAGLMSILGLIFLISSKMKAASKATAEQAVTEAAKNGKETTGAAAHVNAAVGALKTELQGEQRDNREELGTKVELLRVEMRTSLETLRRELTIRLDAIDRKIEALSQNLFDLVKHKGDGQ